MRNTEAAYKGAVTTMKTNMMQLSKFISWSVFGDGFVGYSNNNKNAHYAIQRSPEHKDYINMISDKFSELQDCNVSVGEYIRKDNNKSVIFLRTSSHPIFSRIRERQYQDGHRVIDPHQLTFLDWEAMAILYMDDGSLCVNNKGSLITRISTCAYCYAEQELLRIEFIKRFNLIFNINKCGKFWQLNLAKQSRDLFYKNITPYILDSYKYKLPEFLQKGTPRTGGDLVCIGGSPDR